MDGAGISGSKKELDQRRMRTITKARAYKHRDLPVPLEFNVVQFTRDRFTTPYRPIAHHPFIKAEGVNIGTDN